MERYTCQLYPAHWVETMYSRFMDGLIVGLQVQRYRRVMQQGVYFLQTRIRQFKLDTDLVEIV